MTTDLTNPEERLWLKALFAQLRGCDVTNVSIDFKESSGLVDLSAARLTHHGANPEMYRKASDLLHAESIGTRFRELLRDALRVSAGSWPYPREESQGTIYVDSIAERIWVEGHCYAQVSTPLKDVLLPPLAQEEIYVQGASYEGHSL